MSSPAARPILVPPDQASPFKGEEMRVRPSRSRVVLLAAVAAASLACGARPGKPKPPERPPIAFSDPSGASTNEFQLHDSLLVELRDLTPRAGYELTIADEAGHVVIGNRLSTDARGRIPQTVLWYAIGARPCWRAATDVSIAPLSFAGVTDATLADRSYTLSVTRAGEPVRKATFRVARAALRPSLYTTDARGCPKTGFLIGEEDVWVVGRNFPAGGLLRLWTTGDRADWTDNTPLEDRTGQYGYDWPSLVELGPAETQFRRKLWPRGLTSIGSYDMVAETVSYPFGAYRDAPKAKAQDVVAQRTFSAFVVQRRPGAAEPIETDVAGAVSSPFTFRSTFLSNEDVYVGVDPALQPSVIGQTADVYIVADKTDAQWTVDQTLTDVTGTVETITVNGICGNCWKTLAWTAPLAVGRYDVVLDFNRDGVYTPGTDLIDSLDPAGFTVADVRVDQVAFNFPGSGAVTLRDHLAAADVAPPEFVSAGHLVKPAAWTMGGTHSVRVRFKAIPGLASAQLFAEGGLGGLGTAAAPVTVSFSGGFGEADFPVNAPPGAVGRTVFAWDWKRRVGATTVDLGRTGEHLLFTLLAPPQAPQAVPWVATLEMATVAAQGETTAAGATRKVWDRLYNGAGGSYDTVGGAPRYTGGTTANFNLTLFLQNLGAGNIGVVNCYDMGKAVVVFANALGATAEYTYTGPFGYLNLVKPIGKGWANNPFYDGGFGSSLPVVDGDWSFTQGRTSFGNHAFARLGGQIYDASGGQVDTDGDPDTLPAGSPRPLDGSDSWTASYRTRVIDDVPASAPGTPTVYAFSVY
jgi:hypothetical protein